MVFTLSMKDDDGTQYEVIIDPTRTNAKWGWRFWYPLYLHFLYKCGHKSEWLWNRAYHDKLPRRFPDPRIQRKENDNV